MAEVKSHPEGILRYEYIFGSGYISSGGGETTKELLQSIKLPPKAKILDIGCGIGGGSAYVAEYFGAHVHGIDLSANVISIANERYADRENTFFEVADALKVEFPDESFDLIYSRDTILHMTVEEKNELFRKCHKWTKPGGQILITDYCCGGKTIWTDEFQKYVKQRDYHLLEIENYGKLIESHGFEIQTAADNTVRWVKCLREEVDKMEKNRDLFLEKFTTKDLEDLESGWKVKIERAQNGVQLWGLFIATKKQ